jgi:hypothetical protein
LLFHVLVLSPSGDWEALDDFFLGCTFQYSLCSRVKVILSLLLGLIWRILVVCFVVPCVLPSIDLGSAGHARDGFTIRVL